MRLCGAETGASPQCRRGYARPVSSAALPLERSFACFTHSSRIIFPSISVSPLRGPATRRVAASTRWLSVNRGDRKWWEQVHLRHRDISVGATAVARVRLIDSGGSASGMSSRMDRTRCPGIGRTRERHHHCPFRGVGSLLYRDHLLLRGYYVFRIPRPWVIIPSSSYLYSHPASVLLPRIITARGQFSSFQAFTPATGRARAMTLITSTWRLSAPNARTVASSRRRRA
ncbi:hypothetical protein K438DRAFT_588099 [Mycena galopus ATCC 62051]|nr:hypothetical protein K438DRAFT_588099 [Mycena galopus ATCC 62051]